MTVCKYLGPTLLVTVLAILTVCQETPFTWMPYDNFDIIMDKMTSVTAQNCRSKSRKDIELPAEAVSQIPKYNQLLSNIFFANRTCLLQLHSMALNRAYYYSFIYQYLNETEIDFKYQPGLMYYYMSMAADVSAGTGCINGSALYFDNDVHYANFLITLPFNKTLPLFAPRAWRADDYNEPTNWLREPSNYTTDVHDMSAGRDTNYTHPLYKPNPWYKFFLPDLESNVDTLRKFTYTVSMKLSNTTGKFIHKEYQGTPFFGPPQPGQQDSDDLSMPVRFTQPYFDCGHSNKWIVSAAAPVVDFMPRYTNWTHTQRARFVGEAVMDIEFERIDLNPCPVGEGNPAPNFFANTARCKDTTMCEPLSGFGFRRGGYRCVCKPGYRYPWWHNGPFLGWEIEQATKEEYERSFDCLSIGADMWQYTRREVNMESLGGYTLLPPDTEEPISVPRAKNELRVIPREPPVTKINKRSLTAKRHEKHEVPLTVKYENQRQRFVRSILPQPSRTSRRLLSQEREEKIEKRAAAERKRRVHYVPRTKRTVGTVEQKTSKTGKGSFDQSSYDRMQRLRNRMFNVDATKCHSMKDFELLLPGDVGYGVDIQFETQARTGLRLAHFLSNFLQNVNEDEQFGDIRGDRLLNETHIYGEVLSNIMGDFKIYASGVFFDKYKFRMSPPVNNTDPRFSSGITREYFGPFAFRTPSENKQGQDDFKAIDFAGFKTPYTTNRWFIDMKSRWSTNFYSLKKYTMRSMVRYDRNGSSAVRFEHYPMFYRAASYEDGVWLRPQFKCDGMVNEWVLTYVAPFFGMNSLRTQLEFKGVVTIDVKLEELDINQCPQNFDVANAFKNTARCDFKTTYCEALPGKRFTLGSYKCECEQGYEYPFQEQAWFFDGQTMEDEWRKMMDGEPNRFETLKCRIGGSAYVVGSWILVSVLSMMSLLIH